MFLLNASKNVLTIKQKEIVTSGSVNVYQVQFTCNSDWDGLTKTAVFKAGTTTISIILDETKTCVIPWEVLVAANRVLYAGLYGTKDGELVLPTIWATLGTIREGTTTGESATPPTPDLYEQILGEIGDLDGLLTKDKSSIVSAINEVYLTGGGGGDWECKFKRNNDHKSARSIRI